MVSEQNSADIKLIFSATLVCTLAVPENRATRLEVQA